MRRVVGELKDCQLHQRVVKTSFPMTWRRRAKDLDFLQGIRKNLFLTDMVVIVKGATFTGLSPVSLMMNKINKNWEFRNIKFMIHIW